jgi:hypothetical protein
VRKYEGMLCCQDGADAPYETVRQDLLLPRVTLTEVDDGVRVRRHEAARGRH